MPVDEKTLSEFLAGRHVASLATESRDGSVHLTAMWYLYEGGSIYIPTSSGSQKAKNVVRRPYASVMVDSRGSEPYRGGATHGPVEIIGGEQAAKLRDRVWARYMTPDGLADPGLRDAAAHDNVVLRISCGAWTWWDMNAVFGALWSERTISPLDP